jgi:hypothetical protein
MKRGKIDLFGLFLLFMLAFGIYAGLMFVPVYIDNFSVSHAVAVGCNLASIGSPDRKVRSEIRELLRPGGEDAVPALHLSDDQIVIERNHIDHTVSVRLDYARHVKLEPFGRTVTLAFHPKSDSPMRR